LSEISLASADPVKAVWHSLHGNIPSGRTCKPARASQVLYDWERTVTRLSSVLTLVF